MLRIITHQHTCNVRSLHVGLTKKSLKIPKG